MLNIAFDELTRCCANDVLFRYLGLGVDESHYVLQLISEPECAARLIQRRARPHSARERLIERPAVHHQIECGLGCSYLDHCEPSLPARDIRIHALPRRLRRAMARDDLAYDILALGSAEQHHDVARRTGLDRYAHLHRATRVYRRANRPRQPCSLQPGRARYRSVSAKKLAAVCGIVRDTLADRGESDGLGKFRVEIIASEHRLGLLVEARAHLVLRQLASDSEHPLEVPRQSKLFARCSFIAKRQHADLHRIGLIHSESQ